MSQLNLLLVTDAQEGAMLADFLLRRACRVEVCQHMDMALDALTAHQTNRSPYHVVIADLADPFQGLSLSGIIRDRHIPNISIAWLGEQGLLTPAVLDQQAPLGVDQVFAKPVDLARLSTFIEHRQHALEAGLSLDSSVHKTLPEDESEEVEAVSDQPFFGSSSGTFSTSAAANTSVSAAAFLIATSVQKPPIDVAVAPSPVVIRNAAASPTAPVNESEGRFQAPFVPTFPLTNSKTLSRPKRSSTKKFAVPIARVCLKLCAGQKVMSCPASNAVASIASCLNRAVTSPTL